jgi:hypothetical protein
MMMKKRRRRGKKRKRRRKRIVRHCSKCFIHCNQSSEVHVIMSV